MKIDRLETHDRLQHLQKDQGLNLAQGAEDCLKNNRLSIGLQQYSPYVYIFAHPRTADDGITKRMLWQPRLTKPKAQTNSYLFRAISNTDQLEICWMIPPREMWPQMRAGQLTANPIADWSIALFNLQRHLLEAPFDDDLPDHKIKEIYSRVAMEIDEEKRMAKMYSLKPQVLDGK
jgi:hypothetical protein